MVASFGPRIRAFLVTLIAASGMGLWLAQAGETAVETAAPAGPATCVALSCDGCGAGGHGAAGSGACLALCAAAAQAILPAELSAPPPASRAAFQARAVSSDGRSYSPDHGPPRFLTSG
jgi:hypothetical protein